MGSTPALEFPLGTPTGVAVDSSGEFYVAGSGWNGIHGAIIVSVVNGQATAIADGGSNIGDGGPATAGQLFGPDGIAIDRSGALYIADCSDDRIRLVKGGSLTTAAGSGDYGSDTAGQSVPAANAHLAYPSAVTTDGAGNVYLAQGGTAAYIRKLSQGIITTVAEEGPSPAGDGVPKIGGAGSIVGLAASSAGDLYFTDASDHQVRKLSNGVITTAVGNGIAGYSGDGGPAQNAQLNFPMGLAVDAFDNLYIADRNNGVIRKVANGMITTVAGPLSNVNEVAVDGRGNLYVADGWSVYGASSGALTKIADGSAKLGDDGSVAPSAQLWQPTALAADAAGCLYVSDSLNNRILVFAPILGGAPLAHRGMPGENLQTVAPRRAVTTACGTAPQE